METWKQIVGFPGYEVSDLGRVRSWKPCARYGKELPRLMVPGPSTNGYMHVVLMRTGKQWTKSVHVAVLESFVGPCPPGMECRHYPDNTRSNCRLSNLSWATRKENAQDRVVMGTQARGDRSGLRLHPEAACRGERHPSAKVTVPVVSLMRWLHASDRTTVTQLAEWFGIGQPTASHIVSGRTWKHVPMVAP